LLREPSLGGERGSALVLVPAGFVLLLVLAGIAVDAAVSFLGEREVADAAAAAANDAVVLGLDEPGFYSSGYRKLVPARVATAVQRVEAARAAGAVEDLVLVPRIDPAADGVPTVTVTASATVDLVITPAVVPGLGSRAVDAVATARAESTGPTGC